MNLQDGLLDPDGEEDQLDGGRPSQYGNHGALRGRDHGRSGSDSPDLVSSRKSTTDTRNALKRLTSSKIVVL